VIDVPTSTLTGGLWPSSMRHCLDGFFLNARDHGQSSRTDRDRSDHRLCLHAGVAGVCVQLSEEKISSHWYVDLRTT